MQGMLSPILKGGTCQRNDDFRYRLNHLDLLDTQALYGFLEFPFFEALKCHRVSLTTSQEQYKKVKKLFQIHQF